MNGFTRKKVGSLTLGERLQKTRCERRISLNEVSRSTQIQIGYLENLERGEYDKLPADVYVKGFLRNYAGYLGISEKSLLKSYEREKGIQKNMKKEKGSEAKKETVKIATFAITPKYFIISAIVLSVFGGFFYLYKEFDSFVSAPRLVIIAPLDGEATERRETQLKGITDRGSRILINEQSPKC